jgi:transcription antitermination factor NusG
MRPSHPQHTGKTEDAKNQSELLWFVAHTRPRCEKKLKKYIDREGFHTVLPTVKNIHKYRGKTVSFNKPLFPGYLFLQINQIIRQKVYQSDYVANLLTIPDQKEFDEQLSEILSAIETGIELQLAPEIGAGKRVIVRSGPMRGVEGWVEQRYGMSTVLLRLDFIGQAAAMTMDADTLELV